MNLKNIPGWKTNRRLVVFAVDDYGNIRLHSKSALEILKNNNLPLDARFDSLDSLETRLDLEYLFDVLRSVRDSNGNHAIFTPYALPCNINFEAMALNSYTKYVYEELGETYDKLSAEMPEQYEGTCDLILEGIKDGVFIPEFHGREHYNLHLLNKKMQKRDASFMKNMEQRCYAGINEDPELPAISFTESFAFWDPIEIKVFPEIIKTGIQSFKNVFGYRPLSFTPPGHQYHQSMETVLINEGIKFFDKPLFTKRHIGFGKHKIEINTTGRHPDGYTCMVRNVVFEPTEKRSLDWVGFTMKQIEAAFKWKKPAIVSSHRVNYCGHINPENRKEGLNKLKELLSQIVKRWPDVEFISVRDLGSIINNK